MSQSSARPVEGIELVVYLGLIAIVLMVAIAGCKDAFLDGRERRADSADTTPTVKVTDCIPEDPVELAALMKEIQRPERSTNASD